MGFYPPDALVHEAQRRGVRVAGPDANRSRVLCHVERLTRRARGADRPRLREGGARGGDGGLVAERERGGAYAGSPTSPRARASAAPAWSGSPGPAPSTRWSAPARSRGPSPFPSAAAGGGRRSGRPGCSGPGCGTGRDCRWRCRWSRPRRRAWSRSGDWEKVIADYRSTGMTLDKHPMELMRAGLDPELFRSTDLERVDNGATVEVAGMVVARQRPETAKGIVFMLLEDERGTVNLIVPPPVYERCRAAVRAAPLVRARGRLERREGTTNVLVSELGELGGLVSKRGEAPKGQGGQGRPGPRAAAAELAPSRLRPQLRSRPALMRPPGPRPARASGRGRGNAAPPACRPRSPAASSAALVELELTGDHGAPGCRGLPRSQPPAQPPRRGQLDLASADIDAKPPPIQSQLIAGGQALCGLGVEERAQGEDDRVGADLLGPGRLGRPRPPGAEPGDDRLQPHAPVGQLVHPGAGRWIQLPPPYGSRSLELAKSLCQDVGAGGWQALAQVGEALRAQQQLANDQQRPTLADEVESVGETTRLAIGALGCHGPKSRAV